MTNLHPQAVVLPLPSYRLIPLTRGKVAIVDEADFDWLNQWKWHTKVARGGLFYAIRAIHKYGKGRVVTRWIRMHNFVLGVERGADHRNGDGLDNRRNNLRKATHQQNCRNQKLRIDSTSGIKGVTWCKRTGKWQVHISVNKRRRFLGRFLLREDAIAVRRAAEKRYYGEFART